MLKIIGGIASGIVLKSPETEMEVRPTLGRGREALFSSVNANLAGSGVLDLFAGSGALGLEAASRGAARVVMVERNPRHAGIIRHNIGLLRQSGVTADLEVTTADAVNVSSYRGLLGEVKYIFADPPYPDSAQCFRAWWSNARNAFPGATLFWELPDYAGAAGEFINELSECENEWRIRTFAATSFLVIRL